MVEIKDQYDDACIPSNYSTNKVGFIQNGDTNKTCIRNFTVSPNFPERLCLSKSDSVWF